VTPALVLASASPARLATLRAAGLDPAVVVSGVDESAVTSADPALLAAELATLKARAVAGRVPGSLVVGCDSVLSLDGAAHGKPVDAEEARSRWRAMRGRSGVLHTGHCLLAPDGREVVRGAATTVHFADLTDAEIDAYVATREPMDKAGSYGIQGYGATIVERIDGDYFAVMGLPLVRLTRLLARVGIHYRFGAPTIAR